MVATPVDYRVANTGPAERKVLDALADKRWVFRSPRGIARQTGLTEEAVQTVLDRSEHVKMFDIPNRTGGVLYACATRTAAEAQAISANLLAVYG